MTDEKINRACAEIAGWKPIKTTLGWVAPQSCFTGNVPDLSRITEKECWRLCSQYTKDRNAIAEMEAAIEANGKQNSYLYELCSLIGKSKDSMPELDWKIRTAPPSLCAEACLRAFGLWEE